MYFNAFFGNGHLSFVSCHFSLGMGHGALGIGHWALVIVTLSLSPCLPHLPHLLVGERLALSAVEVSRTTSPLPQCPMPHAL